MADNLLMHLTLSLEFTPSFQPPEGRNKLTEVSVWLFFFLSNTSVQTWAICFNPRQQNSGFFLHKTEESHHCMNLIFAECLVQGALNTSQVEESQPLPFHFTCYSWKNPLLRVGHGNYCVFSSRILQEVLLFHQRSTSPVTTASETTFNRTKNKYTHPNCKTS